MRAAFWVCLLSTMLSPALAFAQGQLILLPAVGTPQSVTVSGRVLAHSSTRSSSKFTKNLRSLLSSNLVGAEVEVRFAGLKTKVTSGNDGNFEVTFTAPEKTPFQIGVLNVEANSPQATAVTATVQVVDPKAAYFVVSDFDDTIAISEVVRTNKLVENALLKDETTQEVVRGMSEFYGCLTKPGAFALVSGSPIQFHNRIGSFLSRHKFPRGMGLYLRDIGPSTLSNYKQPVIRSLLKQLPQKVVLIGDSGEKDPEVYAQIRDEFPGRVEAIYIRNAGRMENKDRFKDMFVFDEPAEAARDAVIKKLADLSCVKDAFDAKDGGTK